MNLSARYSGTLAEVYDADRCHSLRWAREQIAVNDLVTDGPVLDCPVGTGRYVGIYRAKGLEVTGIDMSDDMLAVARRNYPGLDARRGNVLGLPFSGGMFATAVSTRMLDWLSPEDMQRAVAELRRVARSLVVTIRHGEPSCRVNYTHDLSAFYAAIDGLFIECRQVTESTEDGVEEVFRIRPPLWSDVVKQFNYPGRLFADAEDDIQRIACEAAGRHVEINRDSVRAEYWATTDLVGAIDAMAEKNPGYRTTEAPRYPGGPVTLLRTANMAVLVLDGRRRVNQMRGTEALAPVLIVSQAGLEPSR